MSQLTFSQQPVEALAGTVNQLDKSEIVSYIAATTIPAGSFCVLDSSGKLTLSVSGTAFAKVAGVACYMAARMPASVGGSPSYVAGDTVPVLRKGRVYARFSGGTPAALTTANAWNVTTGASQSNNGAFSASATATTSGAEITASPAIFVKPTSQTDVALVELNLP